MASFTDQTGRAVQLEKTPKRIISTVPSQTELLYSLGLEKEVIGITAYCVHPKNWLEEKSIVGGTKNLKLDLIKELKPDLIIGNKEENVKEQVEQLEKDFPFWLSDVETFEEALEMINEVGSICGKATEAEELINQIRAAQQELKPLSGISTAYFIWKEPFMLAGHNTFINSMLKLCGFENIAPQNEERYPQTAFDQLKELNPKLILLSSEPYAFNTADAHEIAKACPGSVVKIVDGEMFSWYGSRMILAFRYFKKLLTESSLIFTQ